ncbi:tripartite-type tricarboxylate transporter receptor subunit TctC [Bacillus oleivorans]|uniref:Tripartite-type tricarboxylate transporter receptor subunit TctC n=1 Tax=Bacillus oleivorans TaxID=1448271 RepID=A0A285CSP3_9BACI|nr:tripartite tricarboxylate transporter substrate binding protein [Bacillus oleivorans]SNX70571.1 tripartite-type tricarboxylate transporter receptor subunit TctC [Bacillus oleivorans]
MKKFKLASILLVLSLILAACSSSNDANNENASGSDFPTKSIELIVPYAAGGGTDSLARSFADQTDLGQSVAVVNREGGGGAVGMQNGANANPDGYTVSMITVELLTLPHSGLAQFSYEDFHPVALLNEDPAAITVSADAPWNTIEEFIAAAKEENLKVGNSGTGAIWHLAASALEQETDVTFNHVPFEGAAPAVTALLGGHIDAVSVSPAEVRTQVEAGELKVLAVMADERVESLPDVPTLKESGIDLSIGTWRGLAVPKDTPEDVVKTLEESFGETAQSEEFKATLDTLGLGYRYENAEGFTNLLKEQDALFAELIPSLDLN